MATHPSEVIYISNIIRVLDLKKESVTQSRRRSNRIRLRCCFAFESVINALKVHSSNSWHPRISVMLTEMHFADGGKSKCHIVVSRQCLFLSNTYRKQRVTAYSYIYTYKIDKGHVSFRTDFLATNPFIIKGYCIFVRPEKCEKL